jgi:hypothetical protein
MKYIIITSIVLFMGCVSDNPEEKFENLLHEESPSYKYLAYKSVTKEDYEDNEEC